MYCIIQTLLVTYGKMKHRNVSIGALTSMMGKQASSSSRAQTSTGGGGGARARRRASSRTQSRVVAPTKYVETPVKMRSHRAAAR